MKAQYLLMIYHSSQRVETSYRIKIIGKCPKDRPYITIDLGEAASQRFYIKKDDLKPLAFAILKALGITAYTKMTVAEQIESIRQTTERVCQRPETAYNFLIDAGIIKGKRKRVKKSNESKVKKR